MTPKTRNGIVTVVVVVVLTGAVLWFTQRGKKVYADIIMRAGKHSNYASLLTFGEDFLKAWSKAVQKGQTTFTYNNETYNTQGGKKVTL